MAKRDKLYTVNKWNRPFFEEERRRKLYLGGGPFDINNDYTNGVKTNQGSLINSFGITSWGNPLTDANQKTREGIMDFAAYSNPGHMMDQFHQYNRYPHGTTQTIQPIQLETQKQDNEDKPKSDWLTRLPETFNRLNAAYNTYNTIQSTAKALNNGSIDLSKLTTAITPAKLPDITISSGRTITGNNLINHLDLNTDALTSQATKDAVKAASKKLVEGLPQTGSTGTKFFDTSLGQGLAMTGANIAGDALRGLVRNKELGNTTAARVGDALSTIGSAVGTGLMATGYGLPIGLLATGIGKTLGMIADQFGSVKHDNGTSNYIYTLQGSNPQGSNEYLANLQATTPYGPEATYTDGIFTDSGKYWARRQNRAVAKAYEDYQRKIKQALYNNNWMLMQHAINESAMGGKINRKKCNCKADGGFLNAGINPISATGYDILSSYINTQMQKNQNNQDMGSSLGNSFMGTDTGTLFANGGNIHINPAHKGEFTAKAKRHGMGVQQFASHVLAHKDKFPTSTVRQAVFAKNSHTWKKAFGGKLNYGEDKDIRDNSFFNGASLYDLGGVLLAAGVNWGKATEINEGGTHEENPYEGVQVGVDPEGTPNLVEEGEVIWNDYVFSNRIKCPKEVCRLLRVGVKKNGFTFAEVAKKLLAESKERPNDPISKRGLEANMQKLENYQEEVKQKMEAEQAVEQFNSLPPEQQVAIMNQEGQKAQNAVAQQLMAQELQNLPPEQQQAIAQQMAMEQALAQGAPQGMPQQGPSPEEQAMMQQQMAQQQYASQGGINPQEALAQAAAMQQQAINSSACGGRLFAEGGYDKDPQYISGAKSHWETDSRGHRVLVANTPFQNRGFGGGSFGNAGGGGSWGDDNPEPAQKKKDWLMVDYKQSFNDAYNEARKQKKKTFWFNGKEYSTDYNPNLTKEQVEQGNRRYQTKGLIITPWEHAFGGRLFADGGMIPQEETVPAETEQYQQNPLQTAEPTEQATEQADPEMAKYSDEELQDIINDYEEAANGEKKVTKGRLARLKKKAERAERELERRNSQGENAEQEQPGAAEGQPQEPTQEQIQAAAQAQAQQQMMLGQQQGGMLLEGVSPEQAMMMQQLMGGQQMSPEEMAAMELQQQGNGQYAYGGHLYPEGGKLRGIDLLSLLGYPSYQDAEEAGFNDPKMFGLNSWEDYINPETFKWDNKWLDYKGVSPELKYAIQNNLYNPAQLLLSQNNAPWFEDTNGTGLYNWSQFHGKGKIEGDDKIPEHEFDVLQAAYPHALGNLSWSSDLTFDMVDKAMKNSDDWKRTLKYLFDEKEGAKRRADYMSRIARHNLNDTDDGINPNFRATEMYDFTQDNNGNWVATRKADKTEQDEINFWKEVQSDYKYGDMYNTFHLPEQKVRYFVSDGKGGYKEYFNKPTGLKQIGSDLSSYIYGDGEEPGKLNGSGYNQTIKFYNKPNDDSNGSDESKYLTVGWTPKTNYTDYIFGALPGFTGLGMMLGRGAPDMSGLDAAVAAYERNTGNMIAPHLTHGLIRPAIIDPRVTENNLNARRLGTNRLLMNTGSTPSRGATILANDANTIGQLGLAMINNWKENRAQEQAAANFNRETATTNANILNQVDQFNAQTKASMANMAAQMRYNAAKDKIAARDAYYQGLLGNMGSIFTGINEARKQQNINNQRDLLLASGVFGETNPFLENYYGISKVDPETGEVKRGYNTGMYYWQNPQTGKFEYLKTKPPKPSLATPSLHEKGGKMKKSKKRRGYTF